ncbi:MAG: hypothetical protein WA877_04450 [Legionella sp.]
MIQLGFDVVGTARQERNKATSYLPTITLIDFEASDIEYYLSQATNMER